MQHTCAQMSHVPVTAAPRAFQEEVGSVPGPAGLVRGQQEHVPESAEYLLAGVPPGLGSHLHLLRATVPGNAAFATQGVVDRRPGPLPAASLL